MIFSINNQKEAYIALTTRDGVSFADVRDSMVIENLPFFEVKGRSGLYMLFNKFERSSEIFRYNNDIFADEISFQSIVNYTVPKMRELLDEEELLKKDGKEWTNAVLIVYKGKIYTINQYFEVFENEEYCVHGVVARIMVCGCLSSDSELSIRQRFVETIKLLKEYEGFETFPLLLFNVKTCTYKKCWTIDDILTD